MLVRTSIAVLDLLRKRRIELGLPVVSLPLRPASVFLGIGAGMGVLLELIMLPICWQLLNPEQALQRTVARLKPLEQWVARVQSWL